MKIEVECTSCGKQFEREKKEANRSRKKGRGQYCSRKCLGENVKSNLGAHLGKGRLENLKGRQSDEYSPFRYFLKKVRQRNKKRGIAETDITLEFLKRLWEEQEGRCSISGVILDLPANTTAWENLSATPHRASLDRIDSAQPYVVQNVRYVSYIANICKNTFSDDDVYDFCRRVVENKTSSH